MAVATIALGVNAGDMKQKLIGMANPVTDTHNISPVFVKLIESCLNSIVSNTGYIDQHHQR
jgi:hypothetical protein